MHALVVEMKTDLNWFGGNLRTSCAIVDQAQCKHVVVGDVLSILYVADQQTRGGSGRLTTSLLNFATPQTTAGRNSQ